MRGKKSRSDKTASAQSSVNANLADDCLTSLRLIVGKEASDAEAYDKYRALALAVRRRLMDARLSTASACRDRDAKRVHYLSLEFLTGRLLQNAILALEVEDDVRDGIHTLGMVLEDVYEEEFDPGLGNGGLGRLAACYLDSLATCGYPACGYGIRYDFGIFRQEIRDGWQVEHPDNWLMMGNPWENARPSERQRIGVGGRTVHRYDDNGKLRVDWVDTGTVYAVPYEIPVPGFQNGVVNPLILWGAVSDDVFNLGYFNHGDYLRAVAEKERDESVSKVLYPSDNTSAGRELRLRQQYFFVSATLQRIVDEYLGQHEDLLAFPDKNAIHLNDTHPAIAVPELMRLLIDCRDLGWDAAWDITTRTFAYTNHTLMPEALEKWDAGMFQRLLPRHYEIICEINHRFIAQVEARWPGANDKVRALSIFDEEGGKRVRMANLAIVGSHTVNGVAQLHTDLLKRDLFRGFHELWPEKFLNVTNGVTQRRWLHQANPGLSRLISETIGSRWTTELEELQALGDHAEDAGFQSTWLSIKRLNKQVLGSYIRELTGVSVDPDSLFDVQVKRIHEYKRQLLNILRVIAQWQRIKDNPNADSVPRTVLIAGKAAPGYAAAKLVIKLANDVARVINADEQSNAVLKLLFLPNYGVSLAERIFPGSDLSEQISTAGMEASGTGNMKFMINGALTIGTMDGANIEICEAVGREHMFVFGMDEEQVRKAKAGGYEPRRIYESNDQLRRVVDLITSGFFSPDDPHRFDSVIHGLLNHDPFMVLADFESYMNAQEAVDASYRNQSEWARMSILNVANAGRFSSDRSVTEYARTIWNIEPLVPPPASNGR
jgi:glycogen phosphorylase